MLFRELSPQEEGIFRYWARQNFGPLDKISELWHPVVREECAKIKAEHEEMNRRRRADPPFGQQS